MQLSYGHLAVGYPVSHFGMSNRLNVYDSVQSVCHVELLIQCYSSVAMLSLQFSRAIAHGKLGRCSSKEIRVTPTIIFTSVKQNDSLGMDSTY
jgi:hypothetical protein